jgi:hypothetical protein
MPEKRRRFASFVTIITSAVDNEDKSRRMLKSQEKCPPLVASGCADFVA